MFLDGRPPVNVGVTSGGDVFGGIGGDVQRRARRPAVQPLRGVDLAVPHAVVLVPEPGAPLQLRAAGLLADAVLLRPARGRVLRPGVLRHHRSRPRDGDAHDPRRHGLRHLAVQPLPARRAVRRLACSTTRTFNDPALQAYLAAVPAGAVRPRSCSATARYIPLGVNFVQETTVFREFGPLSGNTMRLAYEVAPKIGDTLVAADGRRRRALLPAPRRHRACWRCARAGSRAGATRPTSCTSAATPRCAATTTCSSSATDGVLQRRAALPADRSDADAARRPRRHPRRALRQHGRRPLRGPAVQVVDQQAASSTRRSIGFISHRRSTRRRRSTAHRRASTGSAWWTRARRTASASRPSRSASRFTSTGRGGRSSTRTGKTRSSAATAAATSSARRSSRSGSATTSKGTR